MPSDADELMRLLESRASGDFASMTEAELQSYFSDLTRGLNAESRPCTAYDHRNAEDRARCARLAEKFRRAVEVRRELVRRNSPRIIS